MNVYADLINNLNKMYHLNQNISLHFTSLEKDKEFIKKLINSLILVMTCLKNIIKNPHLS